MSREVQVGDRFFRIEPFNGRKAILAGRMVARIAKKAPGILERDAEFQRTYAEANALRITRAMALTSWRDKLPDITEDQWDKVGGVLTIPQQPSFETRLAAGFTDAFEAAEEEVLKLLALAVIPNGDLADAAKQGNVKDVLLEWSDRLVDAGSLGEIMDLAAVVAEQVREEFDAGGGLGKLRALWTKAETPAPQPTPPDPVPPTPAPAPQPTTPPTPAATSREQTSSTGSPPPTDGEPDGSSTGPRGASSLPSAIA